MARNMKAKKHLGQHFLTSKKALQSIVNAAHIQENETVLEIGPGEGMLTRALLDAGARVVAIETDADMVAVLQKTCEKEITEEKLVLVHDDVLKTRIDAHISEEYKLVANIPYYITGEILRRFLSSAVQPESMTLLVQKEVAERIARSKKETVLSLSVKCYGMPRYVETVSARYFSPPPKVDSAIVHIANISKDFFTDFSEERFFKVIKAAFSSKRKKLINNLSAFGSKEQLEKVLLASGISKDARAEDISLDAWAAFVNNLS